MTRSMRRDKPSTGTPPATHPAAERTPGNRREPSASGEPIAPADDDADTDAEPGLRRPLVIMLAWFFLPVLLIVLYELLIAGKH